MYELCLETCSSTSKCTVILKGKEPEKSRAPKHQKGHCLIPNTWPAGDDMCQTF